MARVWHKLKCVKQAPKNFHVHHFRSIHDNIIKWQQALDEVQACLLGNFLMGVSMLRKELLVSSLGSGKEWRIMLCGRKLIYIG